MKTLTLEEKARRYDEIQRVVYRKELYTEADIDKEADIPVKEGSMNQTLLRIAKGEIGVKEIRGDKDNPDIIKYFSAVGPVENLQLHDEIPWCSAFVAWVAREAGAERSTSLSARSWLKVGKYIGKDEAQPGDIVVFYRGNVDGWQGHVAIVSVISPAGITVIGGNQNDAVSEKVFSWRTFLGFRRLEPV